MENSFSTFQTSRIIYATSDFYSAPDLENLYSHFENLLVELLGRARFTLFFPNKLEKQLLPAYSTLLDEKESETCAFELESNLLQKVLEYFNKMGMLITEDESILERWPFPARYCALLREANTVLGVLVIHEGLDESVCPPFGVMEILEPIIKHFGQALLRLRSEQQIEKMLNETNAKLLAINEVGELLGHLDLETLLAKIVSLTLQLIHAEVANLMLVESGKLESRVEWGLTDEVIQGIRWRDDGPLLVERVLERRLPILVEELHTDPRFALKDCSRQIQSIVSIPLYTSNKDLGVLNVVNTQGGESFSKENMATLQTVAGLASTAVENAMLHKEAIEREVFQEQLRIARQIWENILPRKIPDFPGATIGARSVPASIVGGDFYDFIPLSEDRLGLVIADVSGKGIPAAMVMNMAKSVLHIEAMLDNPPGEVLKNVNNILVDSTRIDSFVTLAYIVIDKSKNRVVITNAGHNPCLFYRSSTQSCELFPSENMPLGIIEELEFSQIEVEFQPGDCLVLYTDGVTEAMNRNREMYEMERLQALIDTIEEYEPAESILEKIYSDVNNFVKDVAQHDDMTALVFRISQS